MHPCVRGRVARAARRFASHPRHTGGNDLPKLEDASLALEMDV